ncbi:MAG: class I SAM-dependent DNA methyltransferase, partial [Acidimicrobiales bacterium]
RRGYDVSGVDIDPHMLGEAVRKEAGIDWMLGDLADCRLPDCTFDLVLAAGNVLVFVVPGTEPAVVRNLAGSLRPEGLLVAGFQLGHQLTVEEYEELCEAAGLALRHRWSTWDCAPFEGGDYVVCVHCRAVAV